MMNKTKTFAVVTWAAAISISIFMLLHHFTRDEPPTFAPTSIPTAPNITPVLAIDGDQQSKAKMDRDTEIFLLESELEHSREVLREMEQEYQETVREEQRLRRLARRARDAANRTYRDRRARD